MNSFYEVRKNENQILVRRNASYKFPPHFHLDLEVVVVRRGRQAVRVNGVEYAVENGGVIVIDSYDVHEYQKGKEGDGDDCVLVIPYRYLSVWNERRGDFRVANPVIEDEKLSDELLRIVDGYLRKEDSETVKVAAMGLFLARLAQCVEFTGQKENDERTLMRKILAYVQGNFREDATLKAVGCMKRDTVLLVGGTDKGLGAPTRRAAGTSLPLAARLPVPMGFAHTLVVSHLH